MLLQSVIWWVESLVWHFFLIYNIQFVSMSSLFVSFVTSIILHHQRTFHRERRRSLLIDTKSVTGTCMKQIVLRACFDRTPLLDISTESLFKQPRDLELRCFSAGTGYDLRLKITVEHVPLPYHKDSYCMRRLKELIQISMANHLTTKLNSGNLADSTLIRHVHPDDIEVDLIKNNYTMVLGSGYWGY